MRIQFTETITRLLHDDSRNMLLTGDLGYKSFEGIREKFGLAQFDQQMPRFLNAGVAEQNMVGVSAGLAIEGLRPWVYSIAPFLTYRCVEQIRNDLCLHNLPVRIIGNGGGYTYGIMGASHHTLEDMATLKALPNLTIYVPVTNNQVATCVEQSATLSGPSYLRLGFSGYPSDCQSTSENPETLTRRYSSGKQMTVIGIGQGAQVALTALENGLISGEQCSVFGIAKFPFDLVKDSELFDSCIHSRKVIVVEEHYANGALGESLRLLLPELVYFKLLTPSYSADQTYGSARFHFDQCAFTPQRLTELVLEGLQLESR